MSDIIYKELLEQIRTSGGMKSTEELLDSISRSMGGGAEYSRYNDVFYGINRLPNMAPIPLHKETQGLVLFTRPNLNLSYDNIATTRILTNFLVQDPSSYQYAVRMMLDPTTYLVPDARLSPLVDPHIPYITLLTNSIMTMTPPPDIGLNMYTSPEGQFKEQWMMNDSISEYNGKYDITCTFSNFKGNAILGLFQLWLAYMSALRIGPVIPHPYNRRADEMDYWTRIERYKFDESGRYVVGWFHTGGSVPQNLSIGASFGYDRSSGFDFENKEISVQFASIGAVYNDPIQLLEFNLRVQMWNKDMADGKRERYYTKVPMAATKACNFNGYPRINLATQEMEWWVANDEFQSLIKTV
jgi:hypothetical protein